VKKKEVKEKKGGVKGERQKGGKCYAFSAPSLFFTRPSPNTAN